MSTSIAERSLHRRVIGRLPTILWLTAMWVILWGDPSPGTVIAGFGVACGCYAVAKLPHIPVPLRIRPLWLLRLIGYFGLDLLVSSAQVALLVLWRPTRTRGAIVAVPTRTGSDFLLAMMSGGLSLVTGSLVIELNREHGVVYLHGIPVDSAEDAAKLRTQVQRTEELFVRAFGTAADVAEFEAAQRALERRTAEAADGAPKEAP
ncbi:multisubunit sodium/proton antiporter MrpE subunit [Murinocardiopsis flavida]|uniref:Multisubunit sodium/proton antiporter MrpE subunit n=1 Tax=Murinocardiopsis flavida TaxID=645275 RepID=A0A2P8DTY0_9ACTN|nr:Na+/H+ antiporter subunit E [Murinocardiopsis flavida]PSL00669.1 multisubunit sodium/proton antiporter MrpE subunit [Murinocardiopsis flavida]